LPWHFWSVELWGAVTFPRMKILNSRFLCAIRRWWASVAPSLSDFSRAFLRTPKFGLQAVLTPKIQIFQNFFLMGGISDFQRVQRRPVHIFHVKFFLKMGAFFCTNFDGFWPIGTPKIDFFKTKIIRLDSPRRDASIDTSNVFFPSFSFSRFLGLRQKFAYFRLFR